MPRQERLADLPSSGYLQGPTGLEALAPSSGILGIEDPNQRAAMVIARAVRPPGGRREGIPTKMLEALGETLGILPRNFILNPARDASRMTESALTTGQIDPADWLSAMSLMSIANSIPAARIVHRGLGYEARQEKERRPPWALSGTDQAL